MLDTASAHSKEMPRQVLKQPLLTFLPAVNEHACQRYGLNTVMASTDGLATTRSSGLTDPGRACVLLTKPYKSAQCLRVQ